MPCCGINLWKFLCADDMIDSCRSGHMYITVLVITLGTSLLMDPVDSYSRARLVCVLLDSCGQYFEHGSSKKKLDNFLVFFQVISLRQYNIAN